VAILDDEGRVVSTIRGALFDLMTTSLIGWQQGNDLLVGGEGHDTLYGHEGDNDLRGFQSNDYLSGGPGADTVEGHSGQDIFAFQNKDIAVGDLIADFNVGEDKIELNFVGVETISDLQLAESTTEPGIHLAIGNHGTVFLRGSMSIAELNAAANFVFL
jgi:Ca2+-binding RTX toxin-like protein